MGVTIVGVAAQPDNPSMVNIFKKVVADGPESRGRFGRPFRVMLLSYPEAYEDAQFNRQKRNKMEASPMILDLFDVERVAQAAKNRGFERWELYREVSLVRAYDFRLYEYQDALQSAQENRVEKTVIEARNGFNFWGVRDGRQERFISPHAYAGNFFEWLGASASQRSAPAKPMPSILPSERWKSLQHQGRLLTAYQSRGLRHCSFLYREMVRRFEVATSDGEVEQGDEEQVSAKGNWAYRVNGDVRFYEKEIGHSCIGDFEKKLKGDSLFSASIEGCLGSSAAWPAPRGTFPVYWSKEAMGTLLVHFLRAFEGDLFLDHLSFLIRQEGDLPSAFSVFDEPSVKCDLEGVVAKRTPIFGGGKPRTLATNRQIAEEMQVASSGHARRQSLDHPSTIGFWRPTVVPRQASANLLAGLAHGVKVEQLAVLRFDPATGNALIQTRLARLIHHGALGEWIEPLTWEINLINLWKGIATFDDESTSLGIFCEKRDQKILSEVVTGGCVTPEVHFPGNVPQSNYWG